LVGRGKACSGGTALAICIMLGPLGQALEHAQALALARLLARQQGDLILSRAAGPAAARGSRHGAGIVG